MEENNKLVLAENIETAENTPHAEEAASPVPHPIKKLPLTHSLPAKVAAFILAVTLNPIKNDDVMNTESTTESLGTSMMGGGMGMM